MKEKATGFEALKGVGAPLKELIDKKGKSFSGFGELKDLGQMIKEKSQDHLNL